MAKRILVVDDDRNIGQILHASFSAKGYETIVSRNGEDAISQFEEVNPDLVLLDVLLPKMNGWDVCKKIKETEHGLKTPVILMSAIYKNYKMQTDAKEKYGADDFVEKPFQLSRLLVTVEEFIGKGDIPAQGDGDEDGETSVETTPAEPAEPTTLMSGELTTVSFPEVVHSVYVMGKSGTLVMENNDIRKEIAISQGYVVSVNTNIEKEYFGNYLIRMRKITPEQNEEGLNRQKESSRMLGTILIEMGAITPQQLVYYLKLQMRDKIFEIFSWREGTFEFIQDETVTGDISAIDMSTANLIFFGIKNYWDMDYSLDKLSPFYPRYLHVGTNQYYRFQDLELTPSESKLLLTIDGMKTTEEIAMESPISPLQTYNLLLTLVYSGMCETSQDPASEPDSFFDTIMEEDHEDQPTRQMKIPEGETIEVSDTIDVDIEPEDDEDMPPLETEPEEQPKEEKPQEAETEPSQSDDLSGLRKQIEEKFETLVNANWFEILGLRNNPTEHEARVAYHKLAKQFHPDKFFGNVSQDFKAKVEEIFRAISDAYEALNTQDKINKYIKKLEGEKSDEEKQSTRLEGVKKIILAEQHFQNGLNYTREKRFTRASDAFKKSVEITNEPEYIAHYGWAMYNMPDEKDLDEEELAMRGNDSDADFQFQGREHLNRAIQQNPRTEKAYVFLGHIYKRQGLKEFAEKQYEKALICNPNSIEALRELRLIKLEEQKKTKKKSLLERLLNR